MALKKRHIFAFGFVIAGAALQIFGVVKGNGEALGGAAAFMFILGITVEIIGYAIGDENKTNPDKNT